MLPIKYDKGVLLQSLTIGLKSYWTQTYKNFFDVNVGIASAKMLAFTLTLPHKVYGTRY
jgi:hypothetical protein